MEVYNTMVEYSGHPNEELLNEINYRGGMDSFLKKIQHSKNVAQEVERITNEVYELCRNSIPLEQIQKQVSSNSLSKQEIRELIESRFTKYHAYKKDRSINTITVLRCASAGLMAIIVGSFLWGFIIHSAGEANNIVFAGISIVIFVIVQYVSGKSTHNILAFSTAFLSIMVTYFLGFWVAGAF